jgi:hypothetical protein
VSPVSHVHVHTPHELGEGSEEGGVSRRERTLELCAVLLLSLTTLATAWSGYQAARWSGEQSQKYAQASATRIRAQQQATTAGQLRLDDLNNFNGWLDAHEAGNDKLAAVYERRFRAAFRPAFVAWRAQTKIPGPLLMPQYKPVELARSKAFDDRADALYEEGTEAKTSDDHYILSTVFFAAVLFFSGISLRLDWRPLRVAILVFGTVMLVGGLFFVLSLGTA